MLTTISQLVHDNVHAEIRDVLQENPANLAEKDGVKILFRSTKNKQQEFMHGTREAPGSPVLPRTMAREVNTPLFLNICHFNFLSTLSIRLI
jgi:hypothetical protein